MIVGLIMVAAFAALCVAVHNNEQPWHIEDTFESGAFKFYTCSKRVLFRRKQKVFAMDKTSRARAFDVLTGAEVDSGFGTSLERLRERTERAERVRCASQALLAPDRELRP